MSSATMNTDDIRAMVMTERRTMPSGCRPGSLSTAESLSSPSSGTVSRWETTDSDLVFSPSPLSFLRASLGLPLLTLSRPLFPSDETDERIQ